MSRTNCFLLIALGVFALALPAAAQTDASGEASLVVGEVIHLGTLDYSTGTFIGGPEGGVGSVIWDNTGSLGSFRNTPPGQEILDTGDLPSGTHVGEFQIGFATDASGSVTMRYTFYQNDNFNSVGPTLTQNDGDPATFDLTIGGLPGGGAFAYTANIVLAPGDNFVIAGPDLDMDGDTDWGWGYATLDAGNSTLIGPLIASEVMPPGAPGRADHFDRFDPPILDGGTYSGTFFFGGTPFAQFHMQLIQGAPLPIIDVPVLNRSGVVALLLLLAAVGMLALRRR